MSLIYKILETFVIQSFPKREGGAQNVAQTLKRPQNWWGYKGHTIEVRLLACDTTDILLYFSIRCKHNDGWSQFQKSTSILLIHCFATLSFFCQTAQMPSFKQEFNCQKTRKTNLDFYHLPLLSQEISKSWSSQSRLEGVHNGNLERRYMIVSQVTITF